MDTGLLKGKGKETEEQVVDDPPVEADRLNAQDGGTEGQAGGEHEDDSDDDFPIAEAVVQKIDENKELAQYYHSLSIQQFSTGLQNYDSQLVRCGLLLTAMAFISPCVFDLFNNILHHSIFVVVLIILCGLSLLLALVIALPVIRPRDLDFPPYLHKFLDNYDIEKTNSTVLLKLTKLTSTADESNTKIVRHISKNIFCSASLLILTVVFLIAINVISGIWEDSRGTSQNASETGSKASGETGSKASGETGSKASGETGSKASGETGSKASGETGSKASSETGSKASGETGSKASGKTGSKASGETGSKASTKTSSYASATNIKQEENFAI